MTAGEGTVSTQIGWRRRWAGRVGLVALPSSVFLLASLFHLNHPNHVNFLGLAKPATINLGVCLLLTLLVIVVWLAIIVGIVVAIILIVVVVVITFQWLWAESFRDHNMTWVSRWKRVWDEF